MQHDSIQVRMAIQMFIDFLLEHREELERGITEEHKRKARDTLARIAKKQEKNRVESDDDDATD